MGWYRATFQLSHGSPVCDRCPGLARFLPSYQGTLSLGSGGDRLSSAELVVGFRAGEQCVITFPVSTRLCLALPLFPIFSVVTAEIVCSLCQVLAWAEGSAFCGLTNSV